ncbi:hypothetical protein EVAR_46684_1 [Eumeta japonica]|uniref:Uncharacterized protein n=1 Tax=Eumeta variegata TaxID=151549 RepID=A0A4C1Y6K0_EUMVA|nr:hypothetical protein EVAR_46684_1 [Eumeta japonica]
MEPLLAIFNYVSTKGRKIFAYFFRHSLGCRSCQRDESPTVVLCFSVRGDTRDSRPVRAAPPATRCTDAARVPVRGRAPTGSVADVSRPAAAAGRIRVAQGVSVLHHRITAPTVHDTLKYFGFRLNLPVHTREHPRGAGRVTRAAATRLIATRSTRCARLRPVVSGPRFGPQR